MERPFSINKTRELTENVVFNGKLKQILISGELFCIFFIYAILKTNYIHYTIN